jgi:hypothetical protein
VAERGPLIADVQFVIAPSEATKQSSKRIAYIGLLRLRRAMTARRQAAR